MFLNHINIAYRNLFKNKTISFINIFGLTIGLASALLAILYARHELTYEDMHVKADRIARIFVIGNFGNAKMIPNSYGPEGEALNNMFPEVESFTLTHKTNVIARVGENLFNEENVLLADTSFTKIFTVKFSSGIPFKDANSVIISKKTAQKYFVKENPTGKNMLITVFGKKMEFRIAGVYFDFPSNTHLQPTIILPFSVIESLPNSRYREYAGTRFQSYVLLKQGTDVKQLNVKIAKNFKIPLNIEKISVMLMPLKELHFNGAYDYYKGKLISFLLGAFFVLFITCFNYINFLNIILAGRSFETGIRVVNGSSKMQLFMMYLIDSAFSTAIGFILSFLLLLLALPWFNAVMDTQIVLNFDFHFIATILVLFVLTVLLSGVYPAYKFSRYKALNLIKFGGRSVYGSIRPRAFLTSFQLILAALFIQVLLLISKQTIYLSKFENIGYKSKNVICMNGRAWGDLEKVRTELLKNPNIFKVTWANTIPSYTFSSTNSWINKDNKIFACHIKCDYDYLDVYQIKMGKGRFFSRSFPSDAESSIVINKEAADVLGYSDPVGKSVQFEGKYYNIVGVVCKYMFLPPIFKPMPLLIRLSKGSNEFLIMSVDLKHQKATHEYVVNTLRKFNPDYPVDIQYHDEVLFDMKEAKSYLSATKLMNLFFFITIFMAMAGLFGLSIFIARKRQKESCIRAICGASRFRIIKHLIKEIFLQGIIAITIAVPASWVFSKGYLSVFPNHFEPDIFFFLEGGAITIGIVLLTISWQTWKAATRNPVEVLKYE